jgi:hypothetical protein
VCAGRRPRRVRALDDLAADVDERNGARRVKRALSCAAAVLALLVASGAMVAAHSGPPFPIVSNRRAGPYIVSVWTDPDATDDGSAAGRFWIVIEAAEPAHAIPSATRATVTLTARDRRALVTSGAAAPSDGQVTRQFVALVMDHEGRFAVDVALDGPLGHAAVAAEVDATYDLRPAPYLLIVFLFPFVALGALWIKVLRRRRRSRSRRQ